jgi:hypothetical protein
MLGSSAKVSRQTRARRLARKARVVLAREAAAREAAERAAQPSRPFTPEQERRALARFSDMRSRNVRMGVSLERGFWFMEFPPSEEDRA